MARTLAGASFLMSAGALACWVFMFLAAHDVWHDTGRLDVWKLEGPPYADLRGFIVTFYVLLLVLLAQLALSAIQVRRRTTTGPDR